MNMSDYKQSEGFIARNCRNKDVKRTKERIAKQMRN